MSRIVQLANERGTAEVMYGDGCVVISTTPIHEPLIVDTGEAHKLAALLVPQAAEPTPVSTTEEVRAWAQLVLANNPHDDTRRIARWVLAATESVEVLAMHWDRIAANDHGLQNGYVHRRHAEQARAAIAGVQQ